jgi:hypothetical protein
MEINSLVFISIICVPINNEIHSFDKWVIFLDIKWSDKVSFTTEINNERNTEIIIRKVGFFIEEKVNITTGIIFVFGEFQCYEILILKFIIIDQIILSKLFQ